MNNVDNSTFPRVLIAAPTYEGKHRVLANWVRSSKLHTYPNTDIYLVDNSPNLNYHKEMSQLHGVEIGYVNPSGKKSHQILGESFQQIEKKFLEGEYEYLFIKEIDIQPPRQVIEYLMYHGYPVCSLPYFSGQGKNIFLLAWYLVSQADGTVNNQLIGNDRAFSIWNGKPHITYENGVGCTLIHKSVFEKVRFRWLSEKEKQLKNGKKDDRFTDSLFYEDLFKLNIMNYMLTSHIALHDNDDWARVYRNQI